ncbi:MAG: exodeoxyribonuclease I [Pseudomonadales bacterium]
MAQSIYWYDLETSGTDPRWDRIVQFAGLRTDLELNEVGDELSTYVRLADDVLPNPDASLVTGITPQRTAAEGIDEWQAFRHISALFGSPQTCVAGYNNLRFDDEFVRFGLYRNLMDPYAREWQGGNSRWDIIDLVRATGALRRDGIEWPMDADGLPVYRLELLSAANGLDHGQAHDALADVRATVALARLIRSRQPKLFDYYFSARAKRNVKALLEPYGARLCVHVSGMYPRSQFGVAPVVSLCRHPTNSNAVVVADLSRDVEPLLEWPEQRIREELFREGNPERPPLKEIRINRCPFVAGIEVLTDENWARLGFDRRVIEERQRRLRRPGLAQKLQRVYAKATRAEAVDVDAALYDGFVDDADRSRCQQLQADLARGVWQDLDFADRRLPTLAGRLKARSFPDLLDDAERADWYEFVRARLSAGEQAAWLSLDGFRKRLAELEGQLEAQGSLASGPNAEAATVLAALREHERTLAAAYGL